MRTLLILIEDDLNEILAKGEMIPRYYNPGNSFDHIILVSLFGNYTDTEPFSILFGEATFTIKTLSIPLYQKLLYSLKIVREHWLKKLISLVGEIRPNAIRCYGAGFNAVVGNELKQAYDIPLLISLHLNTKVDTFSRAESFFEKSHSFIKEKVESLTLPTADLVLPVYESIIPYLQTLNITNYRVCYNFVHPESIKRKEPDFTPSPPIRIISVGRQFKWKNPVHLIRAIGEIDNCELTLIGNGTEHTNLKQLVKKLNLESRIKFIPSIQNNKLCQILPTFDIFALHSEYFELSKSVIEAALTGLPIIINRRDGMQIPELNSEWCYLVDNDYKSYAKAISNVINNNELRLQLSTKASEHAWANWSPIKCEKKFAEIYSSFFESSLESSI